MAFGCPICQERLEKLPGQQQVAGKSNHDINIAATPCGHVFHTYCIQKWLTGNGGSNKQCPCCRKAVPSLKTLPLYPTDVDYSLDDSVAGSDGSQGTSNEQSAEFRFEISKLRSNVEQLKEQLKESEEMGQIHADTYTDLKKKYDSEKVRSDAYLMQWKQAESYKSFAEQQRSEVAKLKDKLKQYELMDALVKNVEFEVQQDLSTYNTPESVKGLLEVYHVVTSEYNSTSKKLTETQSKVESYRLELAKTKKQLEASQKSLAELQKVHYACGKNDSFLLETPPASYNNKKVHLGFLNQDKTPLLQRKKIENSTSQPTTKTSPDVDDDVAIIAPFNKKSKASKFAKSASLLDVLSGKNVKNDDNECNMMLRGNIPGVKISPRKRQPISNFESSRKKLKQ